MHVKTVQVAVFLKSLREIEGITFWFRISTIHRKRNTKSKHSIANESLRGTNSTVVKIVSLQEMLKILKTPILP